MENTVDRISEEEMIELGGRGHFQERSACLAHANMRAKRTSFSHFPARSLLRPQRRREGIVPLK